MLTTCGSILLSDLIGGEGLQEQQVAQFGLHGSQIPFDSLED